MTAPDKTALARLAQLEDELERRATAIITACPYRVGVSSSWRSSAKQAALYAAYLNGTGNLAAPPGRSKHEKTEHGKPAAQAVDLNYYGSAKAVTWVHEHALSYGLHFPIRGENWHAELTKTAPTVSLAPPKPVRPKTNVPAGASPLLGLKNPRLYGPKVADAQRVLVKVLPANRAAMGDEFDLAVYGPKTAAIMDEYKKHRGLGSERGVTEPVWAQLRKDARS